MKICAVICEYNPFHNGHKYQLDKIKEKFDRIICIMSGNFTQRAEPAITDKYVRAKHAVENGADMVLQLPTPYACASAQIFAMGAINVLKNLPINAISFGMENPNVDLLLKIAKTENSDEFIKALRTHLEKGKSYASASVDALSDILGAEVNLFLSTPNNMLALEYVRAINGYQLDWEIYPVLRENNYNDVNFDGEFASASAIRNAIENNLDYSNFVPPSCNINNEIKPNMNLFNQLALTQLRLGNLNASSLSNAGEGLENRLIKNALTSSSLLETQEKTKSKRYTFARIKRLTLDFILEIQKDDYSFPDDATAILLAVKTDFLPYIKQFAPYLITENSQLPNFIPHNFVKIENRAEMIYSALCSQPYKGLIKKLVKV